MVEGTGEAPRSDQGCLPERAFANRGGEDFRHLARPGTADREVLTDSRHYAMLLISREKGARPCLA